MSGEDFKRNGNFWQVNLGHLLTILSTVVTLGCMWGTLSQKMDDQGREITSLQQSLGAQQSAVAALQIAEAAHAQDQADLHKTIDDDFARRISRLEDSRDGK